MKDLKCWVYLLLGIIITMIMKWTSNTGDCSLFVFGILLVLIISLYSVLLPVRKNGFLYGNRPGRMIFCVILVITTVLFLLCGTIGAFKLAETSDILDLNSISKLNVYNTVSVNYSDSVTNIHTDSIYIPSDSDSIPLVWAVISQFADPGNLPSSNTTKGNMVALICAALGIVCLSGFLVSSIVNFVSKRAEKWKYGYIRYDKWYLLRFSETKSYDWLSNIQYFGRFFSKQYFKKYVVILGVNEQTVGIVKQSLQRYDVGCVLIQTRQDVSNVRLRLDLGLNDWEEERVVFYFAERTSKEDIERLKLEYAKEVYILGEDITYNNEEDHDAFNIECLGLISEYMESRKLGRRLKCHVDFEYQSTFTSFKATNLYQHLEKYVEFLPFNVHEIWAKKVLLDNFAIIPSGKNGEMKVQRYKPLDGEKGIEPKCEKTVRLIIMGMNQMGTALGIQAALIAHYPNFDTKNGLRTTITFIDDNAIEEGEFLRGRFEALFSLCRYRNIDCSKDKKENGGKLKYNCRLDKMIDPLDSDPYCYLKEDDGNFMDIQWEFIQGNVANDDVRKYISDVASDVNHNITTIAICFNHPQQSLATALYLPRAIYANALQVLTYQHNSFDMLNNVAEGEQEWKRYRNLYPFGMTYSCYEESAIDDSKAKIVSYLYSKKDENKQINRLKEFDSTVLSDINTNWESLMLIDKQSNIDMTESIPGKVRSMGIQYQGDPNEILEKLDKDTKLLESLAYSEHLRWVTERLITGFRPLNKSEYDNVKYKKRDKSYYKISHRAHLDICSNERLRKIDKGVIKNDVNNIVNIPMVLKCSEWLNYMYAISEEKSNNWNKGIARAFLLNDKSLCFRYVKATKSQNNENSHTAFWMADSPVTNKQWQIVNSQGGFCGKCSSDDNMPMVNVSKDDVDDFLSILRKRTGLYFTLPSDAEWKDVAIQSTTYLNDNDNWSEFICFDRKDGKAWPVRSHASVQKNDLNVYDMLGNVWEWTRTAVKNRPRCFYFCGGSFQFKDNECHLESDYWKMYMDSSFKSKDLGFRLIWRFDVDESTAKRLFSEETNVIGNNQNKLDQVEAWFEKYPMVTVEDGFFVMGTETSESAIIYGDFPSKWVSREAERDETPHHYVHISRFKICSVPVTQELWNVVMGDTLRTNPSANIGLNNPQTNVSYKIIKEEFLPKLKEITGKHFRLPTEAEWEYVSKGGHTHSVSKRLTEEYDNKKNLLDADKLLESLDNYFIYSGSNKSEEVAWTRDNTNNTRSVKQKKPISKDFEVYDMSGNIWEWCEDFYQSDAYNDCIKEERRTSWQIGDDLKEKSYNEIGYISNPRCLDNEYSAHVFRGGSYLSEKIDCRCTKPNYWIKTAEHGDLGFRLAMDIIES